MPQVKKRGEEIHACIASIPSREQSLIKTIHSIISQVDKIYLYLNDYSEESAQRIQSISKNKIVFVIGDNKLYGDAGKFYWSGKLSGYILTLDDDLIYPDDYVEAVIDGIEKYKRLAIVTFHGRVLKTTTSSYYKDYKSAFTFNNYLSDDEFVHVGGTGCMGYHSKALKVSMKDFPSRNMADIHLAILAQKNKIPIVVLSHRGNWIIESISSGTNIRIKGIVNDSEQTRMVNEWNWKLYRIEFIGQNKIVNPSSAYIINLPHRRDRYKEVLEECNKNNLLTVRVEAIDGKKNNLCDGNNLMSAHYGCRLSHIKALMYAYDGREEYSLIIEDDCEFEENFKLKLAEYSKQLPNDWDLLYLGGSLMNRSPIEPYSNNLKRARNVLAAHAYIVGRNSIPKLLDLVSSKKDKLDLLFCEYQRNHNCFLVYPELAWQRKGHSDIVGMVTDNVHLRYAKRQLMPA